MKDFQEMQIISEPFQGSDAWLDLRKTKITATDARVLMNTDPWKTKIQLFHEKKGNKQQTEINQYMQRGMDLEDTAKSLFELKIGQKLYKKTVVKSWQMASLDGMSENGEIIVEIKCPGKKDHDCALSGEIPKKYYPQLQHIMCVCNVPEMFYFSFDGIDGVTIKVKRDDEYIEEMTKKEWEFYQSIQENTPPTCSKNDFKERNDEMWEEYSSEYLNNQKQIKQLTDRQEHLKNHLIYLSGSHNSVGCGISLQKVERKGSIDYDKIEELKNIDLEKYRKSSTHSWRITCD